LDITPSTGFRLVFQATPGYIASMTDFWIASSGLVIAETTIVGFQGYKTDAVPEYVRARVASQNAKSIEQWVSLVNNGNNGGYANMWLLADINTNEIASFEQGLKFTNFTKLTDGTIFGENAPNDPRIRNLECTDVGYNDIRQQTGARRTRWPVLLSQYNGKINAINGQAMLADTYDVYLQKVNPSLRTICSHYDEDPQYYVSDPNAVWNEPFTPAGSVDGKVTTAVLAKDMKMAAIFGRADGAPFDAATFLQKQPQWNWQAPYLLDRPTQPWATF